MAENREQPPPYDPNPPPPAQQTYVAYPTQPIQVTNTTQPQHVIVTPTVIQIGRCPACNIGVLTDHYTFLGIFCAIFFFPLGILCCLMLTEKRCYRCGAHFG